MKKMYCYIVIVFILFSFIPSNERTTSRLIIPQKLHEQLHFSKKMDNNQLIAARNSSEEYQTTNAIFPGQELNVKDYGAKGDGLTDDSEAIQKAIDEASALKKRLLFPKSSNPYRINSTLIIRDNTSILGYGATLFMPSQDRPKIMLSSEANKYTSDISIEGLTFNSVNDKKGIHYELNSLTSNVQAIYFQGVDTLTLKNVQMNNMYNGLKLNASETGIPSVKIMVDNLQIFNSRTPVYVDGTNDFTMRNSILDAGGGATHWLHCVYINADTSNFILDNVKFINSPGGGITIGSSYEERAEPTNIVIKNCLFENSKRAINVYGATNITISNSSISQCQLGLALHEVSNLSINNLSIDDAIANNSYTFFEKKDVIVNLLTFWASTGFNQDEESVKIMKYIMLEYFADNASKGAFEMSEVSNTFIKEVVIDAKGMAGSLVTLEGKVEDVTLTEFLVTNMEDIGFFETSSNEVNNLIVEESDFEWTRISTRRINFRTAGAQAIFRKNRFINKGDLFDSLVYNEKGTEILLENNYYSGFEALVYDDEHSVSINNLNLDTQLVDKDIN